MRVDKCPACGAPASPFRRSYDPPMFECDTVLDADGNIDDQGMQCLRRQLAAARAEAERYRQQYEALRAAVAEAADAIGKSAERAWKASDLSAGSFDEGRAHGLEEAEDTLRLVLEQHKPEVADD